MINETAIKPSLTENKPSELGIEYIQGKLDAGYEFTQKAKNQDLVLVIGNTGVGKSTTCNYLLGHKMKETEDSYGRPVIETVDTPTLGIGHKVTSETLYATPVGCKDFSWLLTDCPGFLGTRAVEDRVIESISTELAIRNASQIKGIVTLISIDDLKQTKLTELRGLIKTLIALFKDPIEMVQYSTFLITKKDKYMPDEAAKKITVGAINALKKHCEEQAEKLSSNPTLSSAEGLTRIDFDIIANYFSAVLEKKDEIVFVNPLDNGESRQLIFNKISGIKPRKGLGQWGKGVMNKVTEFTLDTHAFNQSDSDDGPIRPITIKDFNFENYDENRTKFNKVMYDRADDGYRLITDICSCEKAVRDAQLIVSDSEQRLDTIRKLRSNLENNNLETTQVMAERSKQIWEDVVYFNNLRIKWKEERIEEINKENDKLSEEFKGITTTDPIEFVKKEINKTASLFALFDWEQMEFSANTGDSNIPIRVEKNMENGSWHDEDNRQDKGIYKVTYKSNYKPRPAKAKVVAYIKTKDEPGNRRRIKEIEAKIESLTNELEELNKEIADLKSQNEILQSDIEKAKAGMLDNVEKRKVKLEECENDIRKYEAIIIDNKQILEQAKVRGSDLTQKFNADFRKFDILVDIGDILMFPSSLIKTFISEYKVFKTEQKYKAIFSIEESAKIDFINDKDIPEGFKDPITGRKIQVPVVTEKGTVFDHHSLLKQFENDVSKPFHFEHKNGTIEKVEYLKWTQIRANADFKPATPPPSLHSSQLNEMSESERLNEKQRLLKEREELIIKLKDNEEALYKIDRLLNEIQPNKEKKLSINAQSFFIVPQPVQRQPTNQQSANNNNEVLISSSKKKMQQ